MRTTYYKGKTKTSGQSIQQYCAKSTVYNFLAPVVEDYCMCTNITGLLRAYFFLCAAFCVVADAAQKKLHSIKTKIINNYIKTKINSRTKIALQYCSYAVIIIYNVSRKKEPPTHHAMTLSALNRFS